MSLWGHIAFAARSRLSRFFIALILFAVTSTSAMAQLSCDLSKYDLVISPAGSIVTLSGTQSPTHGGDVIVWGSVHVADTLTVTTPSRIVIVGAFNVDPGATLNLNATSVEQLNCDFGNATPCFDPSGTTRRGNSGEIFGGTLNVTLNQGGDVGAHSCSKRELVLSGVTTASFTIPPSATICLFVTQPFFLPVGGSATTEIRTTWKTAKGLRLGDFSIGTSAVKFGPTGDIGACGTDGP